MNSEPIETEVKVVAPHKEIYERMLNSGLFFKPIFQGPIVDEFFLRDGGEPLFGFRIVDQVVRVVTLDSVNTHRDSVSNEIIIANPDVFACALRTALFSYDAQNKLFLPPHSVTRLDAVVRLRRESRIYGAQRLIFTVKGPKRVVNGHKARVENEVSYTGDLKQSLILLGFKREALQHKECRTLFEVFVGDTTVTVVLDKYPGRSEIFEVEGASYAIDAFLETIGVNLAEAHHWGMNEFFAAYPAGAYTQYGQPFQLIEVRG